MRVITSFPSRARWSLVMVARTVAACSPPMTEILELGHMYKNRGLGEEEKWKKKKSNQRGVALLGAITDEWLIGPEKKGGRDRINEI